jgi:hypothetical protein
MRINNTRTMKNRIRALSVKAAAMAPGAKTRVAKANEMTQIANQAMCAGGLAHLHPGATGRRRLRDIRWGYLVLVSNASSEPWASGPPFGRAARAMQGPIH